MTDSVEPLVHITAHTVTLPTIGHGPEYSDKHIWLPQLFMESARDGVAIQNRRFTNCLLEGPAVLLPMDNCAFDGCDMGDATGDVRNLLLAPRGSERVTGVIAMHGCRFEGCRFLGVGFTGPMDFQDMFIRVLTGPAA